MALAFVLLSVQVMVNAPALIATVGPVMTMVAPLPLEMVMPMSLIEIIAPVVVFSNMPPVGPGRSLMRSVFCAVVCNRTHDRGGGAVSASAGTSAAEPYQAPLQIG